MRQGYQTNYTAFKKDNKGRFLSPKTINDDKVPPYDKTTTVGTFFTTREIMGAKEDFSLKAKHSHRPSNIDSLRTAYLGEFASTKLSVDLQKNHNPWVKSKAKLEHYVDSIKPHPNIISGLNLDKVREAFNDEDRKQSYRKVWNSTSTNYSIEDRFKVNKREILNKIDNLPVFSDLHAQ